MAAAFMNRVGDAEQRRRMAVNARICRSSGVDAAV